MSVTRIEYLPTGAGFEAEPTKSIRPIKPTEYLHQGDLRVLPYPRVTDDRCSQGKLEFLDLFLDSRILHHNLLSHNDLVVVHGAMKFRGDLQVPFKVPGCQIDDGFMEECLFVHVRSGEVRAHRKAYRSSLVIVHPCFSWGKGALRTLLLPVFLDFRLAGLMQTDAFESELGFR